MSQFVYTSSVGDDRAAKNHQECVQRLSSDIPGRRPDHDLERVPVHVNVVQLESHRDVDVQICQLLRSWHRTVIIHAWHFDNRNAKCREDVKDSFETCIVCVNTFPVNDPL